MHHRGLCAHGRGYFPRGVSALAPPLRTRSRVASSLRDGAAAAAARARAARCSSGRAGGCAGQRDAHAVRRLLRAGRLVRRGVQGHAGHLLRRRRRAALLLPVSGLILRRRDLLPRRRRLPLPRRRAQPQQRPDLAPRGRHLRPGILVGLVVRLLALWMSRLACTLTLFITLLQALLSRHSGAPLRPVLLLNPGGAQPREGRSGDRGHDADAAGRPSRRPRRGVRLPRRRPAARVRWSAAGHRRRWHFALDGGWRRPTRRCVALS